MPAAEALAREGAAVFCTDRDGAAAEATAARIRAAGGRAAASALDVRDRAAVDAAVAAVVREFGRLDIVLESAGISHRLNFLDVDAETWDRIIAVNLTGMFHVGQAAARQMVKRGRRQHHQRDLAARRGGAARARRLCRLEGRRAAR